MTQAHAGSKIPRAERIRQLRLRLTEAKHRLDAQRQAGEAARVKKDQDDAAAGHLAGESWALNPSTPIDDIAIVHRGKLRRHLPEGHTLKSQRYVDAFIQAVDTICAAALQDAKR